MSLLRSVFGGREGRRLARYERRVRDIERLGATLAVAADRELQQRAAALRQRAIGGAGLDALLVEAFAVAREAAGRVVAMRPFDVQLIGAMALHEGLIAEMKTGEGKTLVATLPAFLNALSGRGVHVVTVNDYLAERDAQWMGPLYRFLGLQVGVILEQMGDDVVGEAAARRRAYAADVTYGTNHEIAFDYLRDNLASAADETVHRGFAYAIVDEVDFLLIDEARTPLIISAPSHEDPGLFERVDRVVRRLQPGMHHLAEAKTRRASLTDLGLDVVQQALKAGSLTDPENLLLYHAVCQSVLAHAIYRRDVDYIVDRGRVFIVDEFTGRVSEDKRYADGLHQAIEAKEGVAVRSEDQTVAKVTYQTFFGRYRKLCGMTGTAWPEREELRRTYGLEVVRVPTHRPMIRADFEDEVYDTLDDKHRAIVAEILELRAAGRPVLVGSTSVRESEQLARRLRAAGVPHEVLNAKNHRAEAAIIAEAGCGGAVTISTNMAGRGTDIVLGGSSSREPDGEATSLSAPTQGRAARQAAIVAAGGLHVIGTAHHEAVRIDDQLRGRAGRQGDPGSSQFVVSLDDEIYHKFGAADIDDLRRELRRRGHPREEPVPWREVGPVLRELQRKVDEENRGIRREVLRYDLVLHQQREALYAWRREVLDGEDLDPAALADDVVDDVALLVGDSDDADPRRASAEMAQLLADCFQVPFELPAGSAGDRAQVARERARELLRGRSARLDAETQISDRALLRQILLDAIDEQWTDHLGDLERLEEGIGLRGYAQLDPLVEWRREAGLLWRELLGQIRLRAVSLWLTVSPERLR